MKQKVLQAVKEQHKAAVAGNDIHEAFWAAIAANHPEIDLNKDEFRINNTTFELERQIVSTEE